MSHARAVPACGDGFVIPPTRINTPPAPRLGHRHQWVATAIYILSDAAIDASAATWMSTGIPIGLDLDHENLATVMGPVCLKCQVPLTPTNHATACPVVMVPVLGVAR
jgi:hypothetical protein